MQSSYSYVPHLPPRSPESRYSTSPATSPTRVSTSPQRKVVSDFGSFTAPANASVFGTAVQSTPFSLAGGKAAFGGMRGGNPSSSLMDDDDDDDDDDNEVLLGGRQRVDIREDSISLDQVRSYILETIHSLTIIFRRSVLPCKALGEVCALSLHSHVICCQLVVV